MNISPLDDRYRDEVEELIPFFSEMGLMKYRIQVEVEYLVALGKEKGIPQLPPFSAGRQKDLRLLYQSFSARDFQSIKKIEEETHHDVKAVEYFLRRKLNRLDMEEYEEWVHFALTSEDVNNLAYALMWQEAITEVYLPILSGLIGELKHFAESYRDTPILALTHGQPATPTSLGKEYAVYVQRLARQLRQMKGHKLQGKLSGATGTWGAHVASFPEIDWINFSKKFISSFGMEPNLVTTQIEANDALAESYQILSRINTVLLDLCRDVWLYMSRGIFNQRQHSGEVGSSTMPHKVNPIQFENAEGNLGLANVYLSHLANALPVSRLQRDLSGSTIIRNQGVPLAHALLACKNIRKGLKRLFINEQNLRRELNEHWEVLAEAVQTVLRKTGDKKAYERLKEMIRKERVTQSDMHAMLEQLNLPETEKQMLLALSPETYIGLASKIVGEG
ncbi:MAG: adenylosuccinate lyase [Candidatus Neomarinimicrobiota bacterium]